MSGPPENSPLHLPTVTTDALESHSLPIPCNIETNDALDGSRTLSRSLSGNLVKRAMKKLSRSTIRSRPLSAEDVSSGADSKRVSNSTRRSRDGIKTGIPLNTFEQDLPHDSRLDIMANQPNTSRVSEMYEDRRPIASTNILSEGHDVSDDSPFISPPSPTEGLEGLCQPNIFNFRGTGSMRPGTQTLIQALHAMPWSEEAVNEEEDLDPDTQSDTGVKVTGFGSSIHALYRTISHTRHSPKPQDASSQPGGTRHDGNITDGQNSATDETIEEDFETQLNEHVATSQNTTIPIPVLRPNNMTTIRLQRRTRLASKLRDVFEVDDLLEVVAEMPCWLMRSVLLQGYMYLTNAHLCFFAHIPSREDQVLKSGNLQKKSRPKRWSKFWFVLKNDALYWYNSASDPYFPQGVMDLRYAIACEVLSDRSLRLRTNDRTIILSADSAQNRDEWIKAIRKVIFKAQNMGESVKIVIPYALIVDVEKSSALDFSETIEVKVMEKASGYTMDSYFFAYFREPDHALEQIRDFIRIYKHSSNQEGMMEVKDTTSKSSSQDQSGSIANLLDKLPPSSESRGSSFRISSLLKPFSGIPQTHRPESPSDQGNEPPIAPVETTSLQSRSHANPQTSRSSSTSAVPRNVNPADAKFTSPSLFVSELDINPSVDHTYPPSHSPGPYPFSETHNSWNVTVPSWLRVPGRRVFNSINFLASGSSDRVREIYSPSTSLERAVEDSSHVNMGFSLIDHRDAAIDPDIIDKFRASFAIDEKETLLGFFSGYLFRVLPVSGKFYISTSHLCFRSSQPLVKTRMIIPLRDILTSEPTKGYRFGMHGLILIIKGHEELFFELSSLARRDQFIQLLHQQLEEHGESRLEPGPLITPVNQTQEALFLEDLDISHPFVDLERTPLHENQAESLPAMMFTSSSSTFLTFKPKESLHFTLFTIGSRGDVQPYIALGKRLLEEGHRVRLATHGEFKEWIESYNIEFAYVGGDPAELMRICVENGTFTVSFLKEGVAKFRGWIDDLLKTSWEACQGTDVLIESPSAMGGIHIAEALKIPYFRAFTMPWSRTRAYPHAFAVPERKMGGAYNYMTYVMFDQVFWRGTSSQINRWRRKTLGLNATNLDRMEQHKVPFLYNFSPTVVSPPLDWYEWIRVTGYWFLDDADVGAKKWTPPSALVEFIDSAHALGKKVVYIGFGSIVVSDPEAMTKCIVEAILTSGVYAVLSKGWSDRLAMKKPSQSEPHRDTFPAQVYPISSIPHDWLFSRIDATCHHGGAGTTGASLRAGIPTIIKPFFGDQFFWGDRVEALGIGTSVRKLTVQHLTSALISATTDPRQISRAKLIGQTIRAEDGVGKAVESIYRDLEYARSLIKRNDEVVVEQDDITTNPPSPSGGAQSSGASARPASEDWSVISEQDDLHYVSLYNNHQSH